MVADTKNHLYLRERRIALALGVLIGAALLFGGGARGDIQSLVLLRPIAAVALAFALMTISGVQLRGHGAIVTIMLAWTAAVAVQLVPLPPAVWQSLPGRDLVVEVERAAGMTTGWRPISLSPYEGWNALFSLVVPIAVLLLAVQGGRRSGDAQLRLLVVLGLFSAALGMMQAIGPARSALYLYRITNEGAAVGLFANRNHQALFLAALLPMLATLSLAEHPRIARATRLALAAIAGAIVAVLLLFTGSRAGLVFGVVGVASAVAILWTERDLRTMQLTLPGGRRIGFKALLGAAGVAMMAMLAAMALLSDRFETVDRTLGEPSQEELRGPIWRTVSDIIPIYFPIGSGEGSFNEIYRVHEPDAQLGPNYVNHAHNDALELLMTSGLAGAALMLGAVWFWAVHMLRLWRRRRSIDHEARLAITGAAVLLLMALGSLADYPLRVPSIAALAMIAAVWLTRGSTLANGRSPAGSNAG